MHDILCGQIDRVTGWNELDMMWLLNPESTYRSLPGHGLLQRVLNPILYMDIFDGRSSDAECIGHSEVIK